MALHACELRHKRLFTEKAFFASKKQDAGYEMGNNYKI